MSPAAGGPGNEFAPGGVSPGEGERPHAEDVALARRAQAGDETAWRILYQRTRQRLFALLAYQTGDRDEALDLLQEVYLHAFRSLRSYRGEGSLDAWLAVMAIRRARDWRRKLVRKKRHAPDDEEIGRTMEATGPRGPDPDALPLRGVLERALGQLHERPRAAFLLREVEDLSFREVAEALGVNEATARVHHLRARRALQGLLKDEPAAQAFVAEGDGPGGDTP